jgi:hypothetical protein
VANEQSETPAEKRIIGSWRIEGGDYPLINEYRSDGTLVQHIDDRSGEPIPFRIEGDLLITSLEQPDGSVFENKTRFAISDDTLTFFDSDGTRRVFGRTSSLRRGYH